MTSNPYEFCQYIHTDGRRCVSGFNHGNGHNVMPQSSASVQAINRQEASLKRMGAELTGEVIVKGIDDAVRDEVAAHQREMVIAQQTRDAAVFGLVEEPPAPITEVQPVPPETQTQPTKESNPVPAIKESTPPVESATESAEGVQKT